MGSHEGSPKGRYSGVPKVLKDITAGTCGEARQMLFMCTTVSAVQAAMHP